MHLAPLVAAVRLENARPHLCKQLQCSHFIKTSPTSLDNNSFALFSSGTTVSLGRNPGTVYD